MQVGSGAVASCTSIQSGGSLTIIRGGIHRGSLQIEDGAEVVARYKSEIDFTISNHSVTGEYLINNISLIQGSPTYTITISENQANGTYKLAQGAENFNENITIYDDIWEYGTLNSMGESMICEGVTYTLKNENGNLTLTIESDVVSDITNLHASENKVSWTGNSEEYAVEISQNNFTSVLKVNTNGSVFRTYQAPRETWNVRINTDTQTNFTNSAPGSTPVHVISDADGNMDLFFANADEIWGLDYTAQHLGIMDAWAGTKEKIFLTGKNKITDIFEGSCDTNVLVLTDDPNGDALFVDDIYTALGNQVRLTQIEEIRAGAGDDIVDMTSQRYGYVGDGVSIYGGLGNDIIWANNGNNILFGDAGNDRLVGGNNNDVFIGGIGNDSMHGGGGDDTFCFGENWGCDTIEQLSGSSVTLWFAKGSANNWNASTLTYTDGTNSIKVCGADIDDITLIFDGEAPVAGAFLDAASEKIFEDKDKGMLA